MFIYNKTKMQKNKFNFTLKRYNGDEILHQDVIMKDMINIINDFIKIEYHLNLNVNYNVMNGILYKGFNNNVLRQILINVEKL